MSYTMGYGEASEAIGKENIASVVTGPQPMSVPISTQVVQKQKTPPAPPAPPAPTAAKPPVPEAEAKKAPTKLILIGLAAIAIAAYVAHTRLPETTV